MTIAVFQPSLPTRLTRAVRALFAAGEQGAWFDCSDLTSMFQDSTGTTPAVVGQPVGLMLDKRKGLVPGAEQITNAADRDFSSDTGFWTKGASATISGGVVNVSTATDDYPIYRFNFPAQAGYYEIAYALTVISGSIKSCLGSAGNGVARIASGTYTDRLFAPDGAGTCGFRTFGPFVGTIDNVSVKFIDGNHATQATAAARPTLQQDANGKYYLAFDGIDDALTIPSITWATTLMCLTAVKHTGGTLWVDVWRKIDPSAGYWGVGQSGSSLDPHYTAGVGNPTYLINGIPLSPITRGQIYTQLINTLAVMTTQNLTLAAGELAISGYAGGLTNGNLYGLIIAEGDTAAREFSVRSYLNMKAGL